MKMTQHSPMASIVAMLLLLLGIYFLVNALWVTPYFALDASYELPRFIYKLHELYLRDERWHPDNQQPAFLIWLYLPSILFILLSRIITRRIERLELHLDDDSTDEAKESNDRMLFLLRVIFYVLLTIFIILLLDVILFGQVNDYGLTGFLKQSFRGLNKVA